VKKFFNKINNNQGIAAIVVVCIFAFTAILVPAIILKTASSLKQSQRYSGFNSAYYVAEGACRLMSETINKAAVDSKTDSAAAFYNDFETKIGLGSTKTLGEGVFADGETADITIERTSSSGNQRTYRLTSTGNSGGASRTLYMNFDIDFSQANPSDAVYENLSIFACGSMNINSGNIFFGTVGTNDVNPTNRGTYFDIIINKTKYEGKLIKDMKKTVAMPNIPAIPAFTRYVKDSDFTAGAIYYNESEKRIENNFNSGVASLKLTDSNAVYKINSTNNMKGTLEIDCSGKKQTMVMDSITMNNGGTILVKNGSLDLYVSGDIQLSSGCSIARNILNCNKFNLIVYGNQCTFNSSTTIICNLLLKNAFPTLNSGVILAGNIVSAATNISASINSNFTIDGLIYAPGVNANINGGIYTGSLVFKDINFNSGNVVTFFPTDISSLPEGTLGSSSGSSGFVFKKGAVREK